METIVGKQSIQFQEAPHIVSAASVVGKKESEGPLGKLFDQIEADPMVGQASWEEAESALSLVRCDCGYYKMLGEYTRSEIDE